MTCEQCGSKTDRKWEFCPNCGNSLQQAGDVFSEIFEQFGQEFANMSKMLEKQMEVVDLSPFFRKPKTGQSGGGFSIKIISSGNQPPQISVNSFGDVDEKKIRQQVYSQLGVPEKAGGMKVIREEKALKPSRIKTMEEPRAEVKKTGNVVSVDIELPNAKEKDIEINDMESSIEVKAVVGDKAFFKILKKPEGFGISKKRFEKGKLHLELGG